MYKSSIQIFDYEDFTIRTYTDETGEVWLVAKDVCDFLGLANPSDVIKSLEDDEKMTLDFSEGHSGQRGGAQFLNVINEAGLYKLTFRSKKPSAKEFTRRVTHEILPSIRKTGSYTILEKRKPALNKKKVTMQLPSIQGLVRASDQILRKAFNCKDEADYKAVLALDQVFTNLYGRSALELAGLRLVKKYEVVYVHRSHSIMRYQSETPVFRLVQIGSEDDNDDEWEESHEYRDD